MLIMTLVFSIANAEAKRAIRRKKNIHNYCFLMQQTESLAVMFFREGVQVSPLLLFKKDSGKAHTRQSCIALLIKKFFFLNK